MENQPSLTFLKSFEEKFLAVVAAGLVARQVVRQLLPQEVELRLRQLLPQQQRQELIVHLLPPKGKDQQPEQLLPQLLLLRRKLNGKLSLK